MRIAVAMLLLAVALGGSIFMLHKSTQHEAYVESLRKTMFVSYCVKYHGEQSRKHCEYNWEQAAKP